ncbi:MAG: ExeM/NucH family extracellular endonuclease [Pseudomonadota bacterium]|nr:ExeM/NucH family extracellular endonuclease [Pseudomonadota bacterium]
MKRFLINFATCALPISFLAIPANAAQISEIRIDQPSSDNDEYFELSGFSSEDLSNYTYLVIGDGSGGSGVIEAIINLQAQSIPADGYFLAAESTLTLGSADFVTTLNFENSDNVTHLLVEGFTGSDQQDLDTDDDGVLDITPWTTIIDSISLVETIGSGDQIYSSNQVGPDGSFVPAHSFYCDSGWQIGAFDPISGNDTPGQVNACDGGGTGETETVTAVPIYDIQSETAISPYEGQVVLTTGTVTAVFQESHQLKGFFFQDALGDGNALTSDGIFVYDTQYSVNVGDEIAIIAEVDEYFGLTELKNITELTLLSSDNSVIPTPLSLPEQTNGDLERFEGMLVTVITDTLVSQNYFLGRYGQMTLAGPNDEGLMVRPEKATNQFPAGSSEAIEHADENQRRFLILDDGQDVSSFGDNPDPVPYLGNPPIVIRGGDKVDNLVGVIDFGRINSGQGADTIRDYRLHPIEAPVFTNTNIRQDSPEAISGRLKIATFNVLNYFTTIDQGGATCGPNNNGCRGADSAAEFTRQKDKIVSAIAELDADVIGLIEIENNGTGANSALQDLVNGVNDHLGTTTYTVVQNPVGSSTLGDDVIAVALIYKAGTVSLVGDSATLATGAFDPNLSDGLSRQPIAQSFSEIATGLEFTVAVNHLKSKRPPSSVQGNANDDQGDGQGSWNLRRTEAAQDLIDWLATNPAGSTSTSTFIIGDLNAYGQEDPIIALENAGYINVSKQFGEIYSYTFDGEIGTLDYVMASAATSASLADATIWHINTDEPNVLDYNEEFNPSEYYSQDVYRSSDHDAVIIGLNLVNPDDSDSDGISNADDLCPDTPSSETAGTGGCSDEQLLTLVNAECPYTLPGWDNIQKKCLVFYVRTLYGEDYMNIAQSLRLISNIRNQ